MPECGLARFLKYLAHALLTGCTPEGGRRQRQISPQAGGALLLLEQFFGPDKKFPTVSLDRWQHVNVNWQEAMTAQVHSDYEIMRSTNLNVVLPAFRRLRDIMVATSGLEPLT